MAFFEIRTNPVYYRDGEAKCSVIVFVREREGGPLLKDKNINASVNGVAWKDLNSGKGHLILSLAPNLKVGSNEFLIWDPEDPDFKVVSREISVEGEATAREKAEIERLARKIDAEKKASSARVAFANDEQAVARAKREASYNTQLSEKNLLAAERFRRNTVQTRLDLAKLEPSPLQKRLNELKDKEALHEIEKKVQRLENPSPAAIELERLNDEHAQLKVQRDVEAIRKKIEGLKSPTGKDKEVEELKVEAELLKEEADALTLKKSSEKRLKELNAESAHKKELSDLQEELEKLRTQALLVAEEKNLRESAPLVSDVLVKEFGSRGLFQLVIQVVGEQGGLSNREILVKESRNRDSYHCATDSTGHSLVQLAAFRELERRYRIIDTKSGKFKDITLSNC